MEIQKLLRAAPHMGVDAKPSDEFSGWYYLSFEGESVQGVYFHPEGKLLRLRRPNFEPKDGDFASAIAVALIRHYGFNYTDGPLVRTIRRLASLEGEAGD